MVWDATVPAGTDLIKNGDNVIREFKTDVENALTANDATLGDAGVFPGASTTTPLYHYRGLKGTTAQRPTAGEYGLYFNETLNTVQRDNGTTWQDVGTHFPSGTKMVFYQSTAPVGWTRDAVVNDRFIRIVSAGSPGTTGGTFTLGSESGHTHDMGNHTHDSGSYFAAIDFDGGTNQLFFDEEPGNFTASYKAGNLSDDGASGSSRSEGVNVGGTSATPSTNTTGAGSSHTHTHTSTQHAYADFMLATKD